MSINIKDNKDKIRSKPAKAVNFEDVAIDLQKARTHNGPATDVRWDEKLSRFVMVYGQAT